MEFKIESGVPYKSKAGGRGRKPTYFPLDKMEVGDSFLILVSDLSDKKVVESWRRKLLTYKKAFYKTFDAEGVVFRTVLEEGGIRVHRTK